MIAQGMLKFHLTTSPVFWGQLYAHPSLIGHKLIPSMATFRSGAMFINQEKSMSQTHSIADHHHHAAKHHEHAAKHHTLAAEHHAKGNHTEAAHHAHVAHGHHLHSVHHHEEATKHFVHQHHPEATK